MIDNHIRPEANEPEGRRITHGEFERTAEMAVTIRDWVSQRLTAHYPPVIRHALDMICTKLARIAQGDPMHEDHWRDIAGYSSLVAEYLAKQKNPGHG